MCGNPASKDFESYFFIPRIVQCSTEQLLKSRGLAAYSVMPANEAGGIGGRSYGRIALYLQQVSLARSVFHNNNFRSLEILDFFLFFFFAEVGSIVVSREAFC